MGGPLQIVHAYDDSAPVFTTLSVSPASELLLDMGPANDRASPRLAVSIPELPPGEFVVVVLEWGEAPRGASNDISHGQLDLCLAGVSVVGVSHGEENEAICTGPNALSSAPQRVLVIGNPASAIGNTRPQLLRLQVGLVGGTPPAWIRVAVEDNGPRASITRLPETGRLPSAKSMVHQAQADVQLDLNPTTINVGQSATLTWTTTNADSCKETGAWTDDNAPLSGSQKVTPSSAGSYSYTLTCENSDSESMETQVLTVLTPSPSGGGGSGGPDVLALISLALLSKMRALRRSLNL